MPSSARRLEPGLRRQVYRALAGLRAQVTLGAIERAIRSRSGFAILDLAGRLPARLVPAQATVRKAVKAGVSLGRSQVPGWRRRRR